MTSTERGSEPAERLWTAGAVARRLGVTPTTLRSWSLRYGIEPDGHRPGQHRRYSDADVAELDTVRALVEQGMTLPAAAAFARDRRLRAGTDDGPGSARGSSVGVATSTASETAAELAQAARRLDLAGISRLVESSLSAWGLLATWDELCRPALHQLDTAVDDEGCLEAALLLSWAVSTCLRRRHAVPATTEGTAVVLAGADGEQHTLALEALFAALAERRVPVRMLGPSVPAFALVQAVEQLRQAGVVVWSQRPATADPGVLRRLVGRADPVVAAGPGWNAEVFDDDAVHGADSLTAAVELVAGDTTSGG